MTGPVVNLEELDTFPNDPPVAGFGSTMALVGKAIGARDLGAMYMQVEPGKRAFPFHNHHGNEEMFVILEGSGTYRFGDTKHAIRAGSICAAPKGGHETAHQIINTGDTPLKYLSISTMNDPDVCEYPDSGKFAAIAVGAGNDFQTANLRSIHRTQDGLGYFDGEGIDGSDD